MDTKSKSIERNINKYIVGGKSKEANREEYSNTSLSKTEIN